MFNFELPINQLSFGQVAFGILHELYSRNIQPNIFPIEDKINLNAFDFDEGFSNWLSFCINKSYKEFGKVNTSVKLWHLFGSWKTVQAKRNILMTAHETSEFTKVEQDLIKLKDKVLFTSQFSTDLARDEYGLDNAVFCPNYFDSRHFYKKEIQKKGHEDVITFGLFGKLEKRKLTLEILKAWAERFGNDKRYRLNCCIYNAHMDFSIQKSTLEHTFQGRIPWNINFLPFQEKNSTYNDVLNSIDIDLSGLSGAEGWNLPAFQCLGLDKVCVFLNAHAHKSYIDYAECVKIEPSNKIEIYDNFFFKKGGDFNQGHMYTFSGDSFNKAMDQALSMVGKTNGNGAKIYENFSVQRTVDTILSVI